MADFDEQAWRTILGRAAAAGASDVHLAPEALPFFRVNGALVQIAESASVPTEREISLLLSSWMTTEQEKKFLARGEIDFAREEAEFHLRLRVHGFAVRGGTALSVRLVPERIPTLDSLGVPRVFRRLQSLRSGLVLVSGKTGAGKTTTLAAFLNEIARTRAARVITLEDPIEYVFASEKSLFSQREIGAHFTSFGGAIRSALREDPDILLVGELRDSDAVQAALSAAETGQLVLASLHTRSAAEAVHRIESFFSAAQQQEIRAQLAVVLEAMISQALLPAVGGGRVLASEVLVATDAVRHLIRAGKPEQLASCIMSGVSCGMQTMGQDIERLRAAKKIDAETACRRFEKTR